jgi:hypothetical protein
MPIREFFHMMHVVDDFDEAEARFDALFSPLTYSPKRWSDLDKRWASLALIGSDFVLELMEPSRAPEDQDSPIPKFRRRFGCHLHSYAWYVDRADLATLFERLRPAGIRIAIPGRGLIGPEEVVEDLGYFFTHPKDTFGQIEFMGMAPEGHPGDPRFEPGPDSESGRESESGWSAAFWRDEHPLGIVRTSHLTTAVADLERARFVYGELLEGNLFHEHRDDERESAFVLVGSDSVVELAHPITTESRLGQDLAANGELPHAITFTVRDLDAAERHIENVGMRVAQRQESSLTIEPEDCFGALMSFTDATLPGDPRA